MLNSIKTDFIGAGASLLCLIHCIATPFVFIAKSCSASCCVESPLWWKIIDIAFLAISFIAIFQSAKNSSAKWVIRGLWFSWFILSMIIVNEHLTFIELPYYSIYIPTIALVSLHLYNLKFCQCEEEICCTN